MAKYKIDSPVVLAEGEGISRTEAAEIAGRSVDTIDRAARKYNFYGRQFGHKLVSRVALQMLLECDYPAAQAYAAGERSSPRVKAYFDKLGVQLPTVVAAGE